MKKQVLEILQKQHDIYINCFRETQNDEFLHKSRALWDAWQRVKQLPDDDWIEVGIRLADADEAEAYECTHLITGRTPDDENEIIVTYSDGTVGVEEFCIDGNMLYVCSGREIGTEIIAWKPFPEPFRKE